MNENRANILIVDDRHDKLVALEAVLAELKQNVVKATSGKEALRCLLSQEFAVILLDVNMPVMDGFETAALIRQRKSSEHTPIIFVTAFADVETHQTRGYSLGAVDYILAPVNPEVLRAKVSVFVELFKITAQLQTQAGSLKRRGEQLQGLTHASMAINSATEVREILNILTERARDIIGAHHATARLNTVAAPRPVEILSHSERVTPSLNDSINIEGVAAMILQSNRPMRGSNDAPPVKIDGGRALSQDWLAAPLMGRGGRNTGFLYLAYREEGAFSEDDESILVQLAQMASIAIENTLTWEAREANRIKDEFLATLSHELRTPLTSMLAWTRMLRIGKLDAGATSRGLEIIERNVRAQAQLIEDLLDVSRIITGKMVLNFRAIEIAPIISEALDSIRPSAEARGIKLSSSLDPSASRMLGDPTRLQQVIWNLLSNSIKFTPRGGQVDLKLERVESKVRITVADTGRGIDPKFLPHVFDRFRQADSSSTRTHGGLGLGLAIVRHLTERHGGTVRARSDGEGKGATFIVEIPIAAVHTRDTAGDEPVLNLQPALTEIDLTGIKVLVVDDEPDAREVVCEVLKACRAEVSVAASAAEALNHFNAALPDVMISDITMPDQDGYDLIAKVRALPSETGGRVPVIALTASVRDDDRQRALSAGFQMHLAKPVEPAELAAAVAAVAGRAIPSRQARATVA